MKKPLGINGNMLEGLMFLAVSIVIMVMSLQMNTYGSWALAPGLFPLIASVFLAVLSSALIYEGIRKRNVEKTKSSDDKINWFKITVVFLLTLVFTWVLPLIHFVAATIIYMLLMLLFLGERRWWVVTLISLGTTGFLYYVFGVLLGVMLP